MSSFRMMALIAAILLGHMVQSQRAEASEPQTMIVAGGCFWCVEADFDTVSGVLETISGYIGGHVENPTYRQVVGGSTGHYEAVLIRFDPAVTSYRALLDMFWRSIDPTDPDGQFCDRGEPYRTAVFVLGDDQRRIAEASRVAAQAELGQPIVTEILPATTFYRAEDYHQDYWRGTNIVLTRFGPLLQSQAYLRYRQSCGRDARVRELWGDAAPFAK